jgi:hypothetical protein
VFGVTATPLELLINFSGQGFGEIFWDLGKFVSVKGAKDMER